MIVGILVTASMLILVGCGAASGYSEVLEFDGNVKFFQAETNQFEIVKINQQVPFNQALLTGEDSWVRLGLFGDGSTVHVEELSSLTILSGENDAKQSAARLRLDIGSVYLAPKGGVIYVETPLGMAFTEGLGSVVQVSYDPQTGSGQVACLAGFCRVNTDAGGKLLAADQILTLGDTADLASDSSPVEAFHADVQPEETPEDQPETRPAAQLAIEPVAGSAAESIVCGPPEGWQLFTVGEGQSFESILNTYGVTAKEFQQANCLGESTAIVSGMHLFVPAVQVAVAPPASAPTQSPPKPQPADPTPTPASYNAKPTKSPVNEPTQAPMTAPTQSPTQVSEPIPSPVPTRQSSGIPGTMRTVELVQSGEYVSNPGMGWQYRGGDYPMSYPNESVAYGPRMDISWDVLNPGEGVYDWSELDANLSYVVSQGKQFSFRVFTMASPWYGGHQVPQWVLDKGAKINNDGEIDYANCVYQEEWGKFVNKLVTRYDGKSNIAFIDISGYGEFNEWNWGDQTEWDQTWADAYANHTSSRSTMVEMDSYARRILADMFIGGLYSNHQCQTKDGQTKTVSYSYSGFSNTQLLMPYAGTIQASQYVHSMDPTVGFRHDCLGRTSSNSMVQNDNTHLGVEIDRIWPNAPVVFETCSSDEFTMENAEYLLGEAHGSIVHDVNLDLETSKIERLLGQIGYKYQMLSFEYTDRVQPG